MINSWKVLYSEWANDEMYTPRYAIEPVLKYIPKEILYINKPKDDNDSVFCYRKPIIWCPFDTEDSEFVKVLKEGGHKVIVSHIDNWQDFYTYEPTENWDIIISNPPFTNKRKIFERALSFNKPFALLMSLTWLNDSAPKQLFMEKELQLLMFDKRIQYDNQKKITFSSAYYCYHFLPKQIIMEKLLVKN